MTDIVVIGGGIAGVSAAARLSNGAHVTLIEGENALGYHASGRSAALFEENYGLPSVVALNKASAAYQQPYLSPRGFLLLARSGEDEQFEKDAQTLKCPEIPVEDARGHVPILNNTIKRAAHHSDAFDIDTDRMIQDFTKTVRAHGGRVLTGQRVTGITRDKHWHVRCNEDVFTADILVNAAGAWADDMVLAEGLDRYGQHVTEPVTRVETSWAGLRSFAPDRTLVLGRDRAAPDFIWCAGQGGYGFQTAPAASQLLADIVLGRPPHIDASTIKSLSPARF